MNQDYIKQFKLKTGIIISLFISMLAFIPRVVQDHEPAIGLLLLNLLVVFVFSIACWLLNQYLINNPHMPGFITGQLIKVSISFTATLFLSFFLLYLFRNHISRETFFAFRELRGRRRIIGMILFRGAFVNAFMYFISYALYLSARNQNAQLENERLKHENLEARLYVLKQQLSPHFLFNSLGILNTLTADKSVREYIVQLSHIYRYLLNSHENHLAQLSHELNFINSYLYILKERFEDALQVTQQIEATVMDKKVPPASLQLLIENAIKHNVVSADEPLRIKIFTANGYIVVSNNLNLKFSGSDSNGIGLHNIAERYKLLSQDSIIIERDAATFSVKLPLIA